MPLTSARHLGKSSVSGRSREPVPAANNKAVFTRFAFRSGEVFQPRALQAMGESMSVSSTFVLIWPYQFLDAPALVGSIADASLTPLTGIDVQVDGHEVRLACSASRFRLRRYRRKETVVSPRRSGRRARVIETMRYLCVPRREKTITRAVKMLCALARIGTDRDALTPVLRCKI